MTSVRPRRPALMRLGPAPTIVGHRCRQCGQRAFPPDPYGCEQCGAPAEELEPIEMAATGTIRAVATVHRHHHPRPETPFTVVTVVLDDGIALKGVLAETGTATGSTNAAVGDRVTGVVVPWETDEDGTEVVDLRFQLVDRSEGSS